MIPRKFKGCVSVLADREIIENLRENKLKIEPFIEQHLTPNGIDLCIGEVWVEGMAEKVTEGEISIPGHTRFLVATRECVGLPENLVGLLWLKTSLARKGIIGSFGLVDAGFNGNLTLAMYNSSGKSVVVKCGEKIVQLCFLKLSDMPEKLYPARSGNYQNQKGITFSRV
ncbi:MAG: dCTP deaminase [Thermoplasmata archaeon]